MFCYVKRTKKRKKEKGKKMKRATDYTDYHRRYDYHRTSSRVIFFLCESLSLCESVKSVAKV